MVQTTAEARQQLLDSLGEAIKDIGFAVSSLSAAYEQLDVARQDELEEQLFRPVQVAYGRAKRTHSGFAERHGLATRTFEPATAGVPSQGVAGFLGRAVDAVATADEMLIELQDSMRPVEVGDAELRAGLAEVRALIEELPDRARLFMRSFGR